MSVKNLDLPTPLPTPQHPVSPVSSRTQSLDPFSPGTKIKKDQSLTNTWTHLFTHIHTDVHFGAMHVDPQTPGYPDTSTDTEIRATTTEQTYTERLVDLIFNRPRPHNSSRIWNRSSGEEV